MDSNESNSTGKDEKNIKRSSSDKTANGTSSDTSKALKSKNGHKSRSDLAELKEKGEPIEKLGLEINNHETAMPGEKPRTSSKSSEISKEAPYSPGLKENSAELSTPSREKEATINLLTTLVGSNSESSESVTNNFSRSKSRPSQRGRGRGRSRTRSRSNFKNFSKRTTKLRFGVKGKKKTDQYRGAKRKPTRKSRRKKVKPLKPNSELLYETSDLNPSDGIAGEALSWDDSKEGAESLKSFIVENKTHTKDKDQDQDYIPDSKEDEEELEEEKGLLEELQKEAGRRRKRKGDGQRKVKRQSQRRNSKPSSPHSTSDDKREKEI